jgi:hypothetical protein
MLHASWLLAPDSFVSLVTLVVSKSAPGGEWWVVGWNEISVCLFNYLTPFGLQENHFKRLTDNVILRRQPKNLRGVGA